MTFPQGPHRPTRAHALATHPCGRGNDPFGYATKREDGRVVHPRTLEIVPDEAAVVRRVFALLVDHPFSAVAEILNREGAQRRKPGPWTNSAIKDLWRRRDVYRGMVVTKRGLEPPGPGQHAPILSEDEFRDAAVGVMNRSRIAGPKSQAHQTYLLRGLVFSSCGTRMTGETRRSRGDAWVYYSCPVQTKRRFRADADGNLVACSAGRVRAREAEALVLDALSSFVVPPDVMEEADRELRRRLARPADGTADKERLRLSHRLEALRKQHEWGDLTDKAYRRLAGEARGQLAALPSEDGKIVEFRRLHRVVALSLGDAIAASSTHPELLEGLLPLVVDHIETRDRRVAKIVWTPRARPFFAVASVEADEDNCVTMAPPDGIGALTARLEAYA